MKLTVLGCDGSWPAAGGATSGYLVQHDGFNLWLDAGTGTMAKLQEYIDISDVGALAISHGHADHYVDLYSLFVARFYGGLGDNRLPVYLPAGVWSEIEASSSEHSRNAMREAFAINHLEPGGPFEAGPIHVETRPMTHFGPALGFRLGAGDGVLAYTGDTGPTEEIETIARGAGVFLAEATWQDDSELLDFHLSARQAAEYAARAGVRKLVLTHVWPSLDAEVSLAQAKEAFDGEILLAEQGMQLEVGP